MHLVRAHVTYYRSAEDSEEFTVEPDVTCLVGKNESGKTNLAQALFRLNPVEPASFGEIVDFPARMTGKRKNFKAGEMIPVVAATFRYDDDEMAQIEADLGAGALTSPEFTVTIGYRADSKTFVHHYDEPAIVRNLRAGLDLGPMATKAIDAADVAGLLKALEELPEPTSATHELVKRISGWRQQRVDLYLIDEYALPRMPKFVYFAEYDAMPEKVSIPDLIRRHGEGALSG
jgi:hypothetical protein